jgi:hypothetical protein
METGKNRGLRRFLHLRIARNGHDLSDICGRNLSPFQRLSYGSFGATLASRDAPSELQKFASVEVVLGSFFSLDGYSIQGR